MNVQVFKAMSDKTRLKILEYIEKKPNSVCCDIAKHIRKDASTTCRHIEAMKKAGIVITKKEGKYLSCSLKNPKKMEELMKIAESLLLDAPRRMTHEVRLSSVRHSSVR